MPDQPPHRCRILDKAELSHDVNRWSVEKPDGFTFKPGQATEIALDRDGYRDKARPFTMTSLPSDPALEFVVKTYPDHDGVTDELDDWKPGDHLLLGDAWGAIEYRGPGTFIAGGAGVTPFISILRDRFGQNDMAGNRLFFSNDTADDVFLKTEFDRLLGSRVVYTVTDAPENTPPFAVNRKIDRAFLSEYCSAFADQHFYLCGPPGMGESIKKDLLDLGAQEDKIIHEDWSE